MRPHHRTTRVGGGWLEEIGPADLLVAFRSELRDDEIALFIGEEEAVSVFDDEGISPAHRFVSRGGGKGFPDTFTRVELQTAKLAVAAHAVDVTVFDEGRAHEAVQRVGVFFTEAFAFPMQRGFRFRGVEFEALRAGVKRAEQQQITRESRCGDTESRANLPGMRPEDFASGGIERVHGLRMPEDELLRAARLDHRRWCITGLAGIERAPEFFASVFIKGHRHAARTAAEADEAIAIEQGMT